MRVLTSQKFFALLAVAAALLCAPSPVAHAIDDLDLHAGARGNTLMAGIQFGAPPGVRSDANNDCEWSVSIPRDAKLGEGSEVTKTVGSVTYRLYDYSCTVPASSTTFHWIPEVSNETLSRQAASVMYDNVPAPWGNFAPPARRGVVNIDMWLWVNPAMWIPISVTAGVPTPAGYVYVTTTATPKKIIFDPGDGNLGTGKVECNGPGMMWLSQFGDYLPSTCMYKYTHSSAMHPSGLFPATFSVQWHVTWKSNIGAQGTIGDLTLDSSHQMLIREVQALVNR
jgi:hypothetical protein